MEGLYAISDGVRRHYEALPPVDIKYQAYGYGVGQTTLFKSRVSFWNLDPGQRQWAGDALCVLAITTLYSEADLAGLGKAALGMATGGVVVTASSPLEAKGFALRARHECKTSCGTIELFIQQRI